MSPALRSGRLASMSEQLAVARQALLDDAQRERDAVIAAATADAVQITTGAEVARVAALEHARAEGRIAADREAAGTEAGAKRVIRSRVLAAQREAYDDLCAAVLAAVVKLRDDPQYPALLDELEAIVLAQLGPHASVSRDPSPDGGVIATSGDRRVAYTLAVLAERRLDLLADEVANLWS